MSNHETRTSAAADAAPQRSGHCGSEPPFPTWGAEAASVEDSSGPLTSPSASDSSSVQEFVAGKPTRSLQTLPSRELTSTGSFKGGFGREHARSNPELAAPIEKPANAAYRDIASSAPFRGGAAGGWSLSGSSPDGGPSIDSRVISNSESFRGARGREYASGASPDLHLEISGADAAASRGDQFYNAIKSREGAESLEKTIIVKGGAQSDPAEKTPTSSGKRVISTSGSFKGREFTGSTAGAGVEGLVPGTREARGGSRDFATRSPESAPLEKTTSFKELDAKDVAANEPVPSATQTEKSSFLWVPLSHDTGAATTGSGPSTGPGKLPRFVAPETSYFEKIISPRRDPYLAALDAASGRSFSDRLPALEPLKTERDGERAKHGLPRPPPSSKQSTKSALKYDPKPAKAAEVAPPPPTPSPPAEFRFEIGDSEVQPEEETKETTETNAGTSVSKKTDPTTFVDNNAAPEAPYDHHNSASKPHLDAQPTMPCHHTSRAEPPKRRTLSFAPSRFKPAPALPAGAASAPKRTFTRIFRNDDQTPRTPKTPSAPGTYDLFKTRSRKFSGPLERQFSRAYSRRREEISTTDEEQGRCKESQQKEEEEEGDGMQQALSAGRYFDALQGPELEVPKDKENLLLPSDEQWPFLLRFPIGCFGVALGLGSQTILWKNLAQSKEMAFLHIPLWINLSLWCVALLALVVIFVTYFLKTIYYFEAVRREFHHPVRVNFFFAPWIAGMFLALGVPPAIAKSLHPAVWCVFMAPILILELKIYGQWLSGGERRLSKVANPSTHLSVVGNFVGSILGGTVGWKEPAIFFWAVGLAHYLVLFVTLYQRLPTNETLPKDLHPVFFLFVAAPSAASVAWMKITGQFDYVSRLVFFIALFLYSSLIVRINFFRGFRFSISWWAYTFPMTAASIAAIQYSGDAPSWITRGLALLLSAVSSATVFTLFCSTLLHAFVWRCLLPNDLAIAITANKPRFARKASPATDEDDGCGLYSLHHSEPLYKSMIDAYHHFLSTKEQHELRSCKSDAPTTRSSLSPESTDGGGCHESRTQNRSASL